MYNEMVVLKLIQSMTKLINLPSSIFHDHILKHFAECGEAMHTRIKGWLDISNEYNEKGKEPFHINNTIFTTSYIFQMVK